MELLSLCLSDIDKTKIKKGSNGKMYLNIVVRERKEPDKFGNSLTVWVQQSKEEREAKADKNYIGAGKVLEFKSEAPNTPEEVEELPEMDADDMGDLPF